MKEKFETPIASTGDALCLRVCVCQVCFDRSGSVVAAASDDGEVKMFNVKEFTSLGSLRGHEDSVQVM